MEEFIQRYFDDLVDWRYYIRSRDFDTEIGAIYKNKDVSCLISAIEKHGVDTADNWNKTLIEYIEIMNAKQIKMLVMQNPAFYFVHERKIILYPFICKLLSTRMFLPNIYGRTVRHPVFYFIYYMLKSENKGMFMDSYVALNLLDYPDSDLEIIPIFDFLSSEKCTLDDSSKIFLTCEICRQRNLTEMVFIELNKK